MMIIVTSYFYFTVVTLKVCENFQSIDHICKLSISGPPSPC